jgi:hypothetical protein
VFRAGESSSTRPGPTAPEKIRGLYKLAGGGAGFMLIDTDQPRQLMEIL